MLRWSCFDARSIQGHKPGIAVLGRRTRTARAACTNSVPRPVAALRDLARIVRSVDTLWHEPQPSAGVASLLEAGATPKPPFPAEKIPDQNSAPQKIRAESALTKSHQKTCMAIIFSLLQSPAAHTVRQGLLGIGRRPLATSSWPELAIPGRGTGHFPG